MHIHTYMHIIIHICNCSVFDNKSPSSVMACISHLGHADWIGNSGTNLF